jgi:hypothetical protein
MALTILYGKSHAIDAKAWGEEGIAVSFSQRSCYQVANWVRLTSALGW